GGNGERIREVVLLLDPGFAVGRGSGAVPDVPLVVGDADRMADPLGVPGLLDAGCADPDSALGLVWGEDVAVVVRAAGVDVDAVVVYQRRQPLDDHPVPVAPAV